MPTTKYFPFVMGLDQTIDDRLLEPGRPRAIENLAIRKKGRLGARYDYDALSSASFLTGLKFFDLHNRTGQLLALGQFSSITTDAATTDHVMAAIAFPNAAPAAWRQLPQPALPLASRVRNVGLLAGQALDIRTIDCAAGNGFGAIVWVTKLVPAGVTTVHAHIFRASTGETVFHDQLFGFVGALLPRIVFLNGAFYAAATASDNSIRLSKFDLATQALTALTNPLALSASAITCLDMGLSHERNSFWLAFGRADATTGIRGYDTTGTQTYTTAGPAVLADGITVLAEATNGTNRVSIAIVRNGTGNIDVHTYVPPAAAPVLSTVDLFTPDNATSQVGMCARSSINNKITVVYQNGGDVQQRQFDDTTHALGGASIDYTLQDATLNGKLHNIRGQRFAATTVRGGVSTTLSLTNFLYQWTNELLAANNTEGSKPACVLEHLFAAACAPFHLPNLALDVSTALSYWARMLLSNGFSRSQPTLSEMSLVDTERRQSTQMGNHLYLSGGITTVIDGKNVAEAGGFLSPPRIVSAVDNVGGAIPAGTYQLVAVYEMFDADQKRIQSEPSDVFTVVVPNNMISMSVTAPHTLWDSKNLAQSGTAVTGSPNVVIYRTKTTTAGNLTFYREQSTPMANAFNPVGFNLVASDATLEQGEVLYTQGARGALSGPLPFVSPQPSISLASSADRVLSGGLPDQSSLQESRGLFPGEEINWSDSIAFFQSIRGQLLAVARLDERRIAWSATELFEIDGPGVDDNGNGEIGAPRRLPSDVGLFGGTLGWRSMVECSLGILFQGLVDTIYLLPRGGNTPQPIGLAVQDRLAAFPTITAAVYLPTDQTVRFTCNNVAGTDSIQIVYSVTEGEWITEGPFGVPTLAAVQYQGRMTMIQGNIVLQQRASHPPAAFVANAWRSGTIHPFGLGQFGKIYNYQFYGEYRGDCSLRCIATYDDDTVEAMKIAEVNALNAFDLANAPNAFLQTLQFVTTRVAGNPYSFKFTPNQTKCECVRVDFEVDVPFPNGIGFFSNAVAALVNGITVVLSGVRVAGDRVVVAIMASSATSNAATSAGWTQRLTSVASGGQRLTILERTLDGTEVSPVTFLWTGTAAAGFYNTWTFRNSHPTAPIEVAISSFNTAVTSAASPSLTPSWGLGNTRWIALLALSDRPAAAVNVQQSPDGFRRGINAAAINASALLSGQLEGGDIASRVASLQPGGWAWTDPSTAHTVTIAVRANETLASEGLVYHYWTMDVDEAGKSALKSPLQMG